ncbi:unnamed protein product [Mytilus edulis]|uniref:Uncharacterized protein n=1 Tax=Mytilus edulis TaxID=6550 RepID=A0A8S3VCJ8_MYTED|nr:unnamed protein product [Mytilus edulis]
MHWSRLGFTNPDLIEVADPLGTNFATEYVKEVMAANTPLIPVYDKIEHEEHFLPVTATKAIVHNKIIENTPRKRQLSEHDDESDTLRKKSRGENDPPLETHKDNILISMISKLSDNLENVAFRLEKRITDIESNVERKLTAKFNTVITDRVKGEVSKVRDEIRSEIDSLKDNFNKLDKSYAEIVANNGNTKEREQSSQTHNIVIKNLVVDPRENSCNTGAVLKAKVETLIKDGLKLTNVKVNKAVRKVSQHRDVKNDRKPDIIFVEVDNLDNKRAILKAKATLRSSNKYRDVYVENNIPREKRMLDFNNRTILRAMGKDKEYRTVGGKITRLQNQTPSKYRDDTIGTQQNDNFKGNGGSFNGNTNKRGMNNGHGRGHVRGRGGFHSNKRPY